MNNLFVKAFHLISMKYKVFLKRDKFSVAYYRWVKDKGDKTHRINYNLDENSLVFDIGGFEGLFAQEIFNLYNSNIFIFEPVPLFCNKIEKLFLENQKIKIFRFGLSAKDNTQAIKIKGNESSIYINGKENLKVQFKSISDFFNEKKINHVDLMKINIEGGEFDLLDQLIKSKLVTRIDNIQVQFHNFFDNSKDRREGIRKQLKQTHYLTYDYYFVWENWKLK